MPKAARPSRRAWPSAHDDLAFENSASWILIDANDIVVASGYMMVDSAGHRPPRAVPGRRRSARKPTAATGLRRPTGGSSLAGTGTPIHAARLPVRFRP